MPLALSTTGSKLAAVRNKPAATKGTQAETPPASLPADVHDDWRAALAALRASGHWRAQNAVLLEALALHMHHLRAAHRQILEEGAYLPDGKPNPAQAIMTRHSAALTAAAKALGLGKPTSSAEPEAPAQGVWS